MRSLRVVLPLVLAGVLFVLFAPQSVGGTNAYVITHGASMEPRFHTGDLAVLRADGDYSVGEVAAYRSDLLKSVVMHRIVAVEGDRFTFKGDSNPWLDPEHPTSADLLGALVARVPQGGVWLKRATSPVALGLFAFVLLAGGGTAVHTRRRRRAGIVPRHGATRLGRVRPPALVAAPPWLRTAAAGTAVAGVLGLALAAVAWTGPRTEPLRSQEPTGRTMTFSYSASVPQTAAYDGTTATSPDPVFRKLADTVDVQLAYHGTSGQIRVTAELSTSSGWHTTIPLAAPVSFAGDHVGSTVQLDLADLDARARAAGAATGMPTDELTVDVVPSVQSVGLPPFAPALHLSVSAVQLRLAGDAKSLTVVDDATVERTNDTPRSLALGNLAMPVATARTVSVALALGSLLVAAVLLLVLRRTSLTGEDAEIRSRYGSLLVAVEPMVTPAGRPLVDVTEFATLAKIAERYGLLVLHWTRSGVGTFVVQDEGTTYRYRASAPAPTRDGARPGPTTPSDAEDLDPRSTATQEPDPDPGPDDVGPVRWSPVGAIRRPVGRSA